MTNRSTTTLEKQSRPPRASSTVSFTLATSSPPAVSARWYGSSPHPHSYSIPSSHSLTLVFAAREVPESRLWPMSPCILPFPTSPPRRTLRHPLPKSRKTLLPTMRRYLFPQVQSTRFNRWGLLRDHLPTYAVHGLSTDDTWEGSAGWE